MALLQVVKQMPSLLIFEDMKHRANDKHEARSVEQMISSIKALKYQDLLTKDKAFIINYG